MNFKTTYISVIAIFLVTVGVSYAQDSGSKSVIKGKIKDEYGEVVIGAIVRIKGTSIATVTDTEGNYQITVKQPLPVTVVVEYVGLKTKEIEVYEIDDQSTFDLSLLYASKLNEVVVVGYGEQKREEMVSAVSKIDPLEVKDIPVASFDAQLQGKAAGVQVNSQSGTPGEGVRVRVRGTTSINASNDPLYIVDGVFVNGNSLQQLSTGVTGNGVAGGINLGEKVTSPIADISPSDIESIEVLKDASATAIYGTRAANGVVIVTTKRGEWDAQKTRVNFNTSFGLSAFPNERMWKVASGPDHASIVNEQWINSGIDNPALNQNASNVPFQRASDGSFNPGSKTFRGNPSDQGTYSDTRLQQAFRTAKIQNYDLSFQGGTQSNRFYIGGSYTKQEAILRGADFQRFSLKVNLDQKINKAIQIGTSNLISYSYRNQMRAGNGPDAGFLQSALQTPSYLPTNDANGNPLRWANFDNTQVLVDNANQFTGSLRYIGNLYGDVELLKGLKLHSSWGVDYNYYRAGEYYNSKTQIGSSTNGEGKSNLTQLAGFVNEQTLTYKFKIKEIHSIGLLAGNTLQANYYNFDAIAGTNFPTDAYTQISAAANKSAAQSSSSNTLASFFSRANYNYKNKYFVEATVRADGSSKFGSDNRWGYFPAVGLAWRLKEETFLKNVKLIDDLKLRGSYGIVGNANGINDFASKGLWSGGYSYPNNVGGTDLSGTAPLQIANPNLKWEKTAQTNIGLDVSVLKGRLIFDLNLYRKYTSGALLNLPVPGSTGYTTFLSNAGEISNTGYEVGITSVNTKSKDFSWSTNFNISGNKNLIEKLDVPITFYSRDWLIDKQGYSMYSFWLYQQLSVDPNTGNVVFRKADGSSTDPSNYSKDVTVTSADRQIMGNAMPKFFGGITNTFKYKNFDASIFFSFQYGNSLINYNRFLGEKAGTNGVAGDGRFIAQSQMDRWTTPGQITDVPRVTSQGNNYLVEQNSRFLEDGSFLRLKTFTVGYTLPKSISSKIKVEKLRVYATASNLFIVTKYTGPDPEIGVTADQNAPGLDQGTPPQPRSILFGLNVNF